MKIKISLNVSGGETKQYSRLLYSIIIVLLMPPEGVYFGISIAAQMEQQRNLSLSNRAYSWILVELKWKALTQKKGKVRTIWKCCDVLSSGKKERSQGHSGGDHSVATPQFLLFSKSIFVLKRLKETPLNSNVEEKKTQVYTWAHMQKFQAIFLETKPL